MVNGTFPERIECDPVVRGVFTAVFNTHRVGVAGVRDGAEFHGGDAENAAAAPDIKDPVPGFDASRYRLKAGRGRRVVPGAEGERRVQHDVVHPFLGRIPRRIDVKGRDFDRGNALLILRHPVVVFVAGELQFHLHRLAERFGQRLGKLFDAPADRIELIFVADDEGTVTLFESYGKGIGKKIVEKGVVGRGPHHEAVVVLLHSGTTRRP